MAASIAERKAPTTAARLCDSSAPGARTVAVPGVYNAIVERGV